MRRKFYWLAAVAMLLAPAVLVSEGPAWLVGCLVAVAVVLLLLGNPPKGKPKKQKKGKKKSKKGGNGKPKPPPRSQPQPVSRQVVPTDTTGK